MSPSVSVVIDNYNYGRYLGQAIEGVLSQDYSGEVECIVVDDGSTDDSQQIVESFGNRVRGIFQPNQGQATAFNTGLAAARGEIVCMLDSDDYWLPSKLRIVVGRFTEPEVGSVQHFLQEVDAEGKLLPQRMPKWPPYYTLKDFLDNRIHFTATSGLAFRSSILGRVLPIPEDIFYYLDDMLFAKVLFHARAENVPQVLGFHRNHAENFCAGGYWSQKKLELDVKMRAVFHREIDPLLKRHKRQFTRRYLRNEDMEYFRRRILLHMMRGERIKATSEWLSLIRKYGASRFGFFRATTCLLALISAGLYLRCYEIYSRLQGVPLRLRLFPE